MPSFARFGTRKPLSKERCSLLVLAIPIPQQLIIGSPAARHSVTLGLVSTRPLRLRVFGGAGFRWSRRSGPMASQCKVERHGQIRVIGEDFVILYSVKVRVTQMRHRPGTIQASCTDPSIPRNNMYMIVHDQEYLEQTKSSRIASF